MGIDYLSVMFFGVDFDPSELMKSAGLREYQAREYPEETPLDEERVLKKEHRWETFEFLQGYIEDLTDGRLTCISIGWAEDFDDNDQWLVSTEIDGLIYQEETTAERLAKFFSEFDREQYRKDLAALGLPEDKEPKLQSHFDMSL